MRVLQKDCCKYSRHIKSTQYAWDRMIFQTMIENIKYYAIIRLISEEDVYALKNELLAFVNHLEKLAITGKHEETGNDVSIYISDLFVHTNYTLITSKNIHLCLFRIFLLNSYFSFDEEVYKEVNHWMLNVKRLSTLISVSGEKIRADFFNTQRNIIDTL
jgi:hypothetical protein